MTISLPPLATLTDADVITEMLALKATWEYAEFVTTIAVTTASKASTLNFEIDTTNVTSMTLALTSATVTPKGKVLPFALPTAENRLYRESKLSVEASSTTAFVEGEGFLCSTSGRSRTTNTEPDRAGLRPRSVTP